MVWVVLLIALAIVLGGIGLVIDALQWLLALGLLFLLLAVAVGFWLRGKVRGAVGRDRQEPGST